LNVDKPVSAVAKVVHNRVQESIRSLGGLDDKHLKFLTYYVTHELKIPAFRFEMDYRSTPKLLVIHVYTNEGQELFIRPKQADVLDKMVKYLNLPEWQFIFARKP
jgi:hypothetical protein